jgi:hypothetical protein
VGGRTLGVRAQVTGTSWSGAISDMVGAWLRAHTSGSLYARDLQSARGRARAHHSSSLDKEREGRILQGTCLHSLRGACKVDRFHCIYFLVVFIA